MGEGRLSILVVVHALMAILNLIIGYFLGKLFGGYDIILAWGIALSAGSIILSVTYNKIISIKYKNIFTKNENLILIISLFIIFISIFIFNIQILNYYLKTLISCFLLLLYIPIILKNEKFTSLFLTIFRMK